MEEYRLQFLSARTYSRRAYRIGELMEYRGEEGHCFKSGCGFAGVR